MPAFWTRQTKRNLKALAVAFRVAPLAYIIQKWTDIGQRSQSQSLASRALQCKCRHLARFNERRLASLPAQTARPSRSQEGSRRRTPNSGPVRAGVRSVPADPMRTRYLGFAGVLVIGAYSNM
ncbi:hypothetical protein AcV7_004117 [Taiwanofungus camphoratus]|nr:hypothetical protein AcV7_004117 [Antrodia cinnamomea]